MGHPGNAVDPKLFPNFGPRARKVLFLSATPVEESYRQLWNQLDVFEDFVASQWPWSEGWIVMMVDPPPSFANRGNEAF